MEQSPEPAPDPGFVTDLSDLPASEESHVEIHKPKPVYSWREFLSEIGVVVIGIIIALSGEQAVEAFHRSTEVSGLRADLHGETRQVLADAQTCEARADYELSWLAKRISQVQVAVWQHRALAAREPNKTPICASPDIPIWRSAKSGGKPNLLNKGEVNAFAEVEYVQAHVDALNERRAEAESSVVSLVRRLPELPDGSPDFSVISRPDLQEYLSLLAKATEAIGNSRTWLRVLIGAEQAVLKGQVALNDIYASERKAAVGDVQDIAM